MSDRTDTDPPTPEELQQKVALDAAETAAMHARLLANTEAFAATVASRRAARTVVRRWLAGKGPAPTVRQLAHAVLSFEDDDSEDEGAG